MLRERVDRAGALRQPGVPSGRATGNDAACGIRRNHRHREIDLSTAPRVAARPAAGLGDDEMSDVTIVRFILAVAWVLGGLVLALLWINAAANDAAKSAAIVVATLVPTLVTALPYIKAPPAERSIAVTLFYDGKTRKLTYGDADSRYATNYYVATHGSSALMSSLEESQLPDAGLDVVEFLFLQRLAMPFREHWNVNIHERQLSRGSYLESLDPLDPAEKSTRFTGDDLQRAFAHLELAHIIRSPMVFPPHTKIRVEPIRAGRRILFASPYASLVATIRFDAVMRVWENMPALGINAEAERDRYFAANFTLSLQYRPEWLRGFSPEAVAYKHWYDNVVHVEEPLDWERIKEDDNADLVRDAARRILGK